MFQTCSRAMERSPNKKKSASGLGHLLNERTIKTPTFVSPILQQVGKLAASVATVGSELSSKGSATGNPRNKCALQPGHSLMDWIRLGASGKDLTGLGPQAGRLFVTKQELAKHSKIDDIWLAIRGRVYNVTEYVPFHPGGPEELMKGAGIDATTIFDQVHPWVNYEQILQKCLVGNLVSVEPNVDTERLFFGSATGTKVAADAEKLDENDTNKNTAEPERPSIEENEDPTKRESEEPPISLPRFDWIQKLDYITAIFYLGAFANPLVEVLPPNSDHQVDVSVTIGGKVYKNELAFHENVQWPCSIKMTWETGKLELVFKKSSSRIWENYGKLVQSSSDVSNSKMKFDCVLKKKVQVNHNIYLLGLERNDGGRMVVPVGKHVRVFVNVEGQEISRSYTPVPTSLFDAIALNDSTPDEICLMIKRYEAGLVSSAVTKKQPGDSVRLTKPLGDFDLKRIEKREAFLLLAAGTGITPMLSLLVCLLERRVKKCQFARLLFFNRKTEDIPFKEQLDKLEMADSRLKIDHVLSEPGTDWIGPRGHINKEMINVAIQQHIKDTGYTIRDLFVFVCGPNQFLNLSLDELQSLEISNDQIHVFSG
ncbi:unnamed protein product [Phyllotreta striolata]|uniref:Cytochrome-b5 reductase n=1 Tax=Phyllotreta striolata TaxID=444603 RepID=A0A9P0DVA3_PHYSR|nr:unnamed protein product [Phyllotreta striolata]